MDIDNATPFVGFEVHHWLAELNAGVVDENVDVDARGVELLKGGDDRLFVRDVKGARCDIMPVIRNRLGRAGQFLLVAAVENDCRARRREAPRHCEPKPLRGAGDQRRLAAKVEQAGQIHMRPPATSPHAARSTRIGVWSEALSRPRISLSIVTDCSLSAACGDKSRWSIRMPLFFCQAPA
jgi:hypothetical protein